MKFIKKLNLNQIILLSFMLIIFVGGVLLTLPVCLNEGQSCSFVDALFTATSATCVTGLSVTDTYTTWNFFGQLVILIMIEIGGLGFMSFIFIVLTAFRKKIDIRSLMLISQATGEDDLGKVMGIQKKLLIGSFMIEGIGALILALRFGIHYKYKNALWLGIFHSISAFCNAGFDIMGFVEPGRNLIPFSLDVIVNLTICVLVILGGLGFLVWNEVISGKKMNRWSPYTKLVLITSAVLLSVGTLCFLIFEWNNPNTIGDMGAGHKLLNAFFQSVTTRTAGFSSFDQGGLTSIGEAVTVILMFIGGASGSTAGGLKVVTFAVLILFMLSRFFHKSRLVIFNREISEETVLDAYEIVSLMITLSFLGAICISVSSKVSFLKAFFEAVSAIATVGLSTGITGDLSTLSKIIIIVMMYIGRVGIMTIALGLFKENKTEAEIKYPKTNLLIG